MFFKFRRKSDARRGIPVRPSPTTSTARRLSGGCLRLEPLEPRWLLDAGPLFISEFMASNSNTSFLDKFGKHSDWIEIYNPTANTQALDGWYLTDNPANLTKWRFPDPNPSPTVDVPIAAGGYLVVFASGEDLAVAGQELHTNFKIDADGGYLALVQPDGTTIASQYNYPEQITDVSYGLTMSGATLVACGPSGASAKALVPTSSNHPDDWMQPAPVFDDTSWTLSGKTGIGFDNTTIQTLPTEVESNNTIATANNATNNFAGFTAGNRYHLAINGTIPTAGGGDDDWFKIGSLQAGDVITITQSGSPSSRGTMTDPRVELWRDGSSSAVTTNNDGGPGADALIARYAIATADVYYVRCRRNDTNSGSYQLGVWLEKSGSVPPTTGGSFTQEAEPNDSKSTANNASSSWRAVQYLSHTTGAISATTDVDYYRYQFSAGDLVTINIDSTSTLDAKVSLLRSDGATLALEDGTSGFASPYDKDSPVYAYIIPASGNYYVKVEGTSSTTGSYIADVYLSTAKPAPAGYGSLIQTNIGVQMSGVNQSAYVRIPFGMDNPADVATLTLRMKYDDGFVAYLNGVEVARRNAPGAAGTPLAWNAAASAEHIPNDAVVFEDIDISSFKSLLGAGNLLAIQGLNLSAGDSDFLVMPELVAVTLSMSSPQFFSPASPGAANTATVLGQVADTKFSVDRGFFDSPFDVSITTKTSGAEIHYTLNGRDPGAADNTKSVVGITRNGTTATATITAHGYANNDLVRITGADQAEYNGTFLIYGVTANTFNYTIAGAPATPATGTITAQCNYFTYTGPIRISTTTTLRAAAFKPGYVSSNIDTQTYIFLSDVIRQPHYPPGVPTQWINQAGVAAPSNHPGETGADYEMDPQIVDNPAYGGQIINDLKSLPSISLVMNPDDWFGNGPTGTNGIKGIYTNPNPSNPDPQPGGAPDLWERETSVELINPDGSQGFQINAGINIHGGASSLAEKTPKHSFTISFKNQYEGDLVYPLFGPDAAGSFETIILRAGFNNSWTHWDGTQRTRGLYVQDEWGAQTQLDMGDLSRHGMFVHVYINGLYWGVYNLVEMPDASFAASYLGGDEADYDVVKVNDDEGLHAADGNMTAYNAMIAAAGAGLSTPEAYANFQKYLDIPSFIDYMIMKYYSCDTDWDNHNWVAIRRSRLNGVANDTLGGFRFVNWDGERALEGVADNNIGVQKISTGPGYLFNKLVQNPEFRLAWADRLHELLFNNGELTPANAGQRLAEKAAQFDSAAVAESARWGDYRRDVYSWSTGPYDFYTRNGSFVAERDRLLNSYFPVRTGNFLNQNKNYTVGGGPLYPLLPACEFSLPSGGYLTGQLTISDPGGLSVVYYTLDGSDPRVPNTVQWVPNAGAPLRVKSIVLSGTTARVKLPNHGFVNGQTVWISGANESQYNTSAAVIFNVTQDTFDYTVSILPAPPNSPATGNIYVTPYGIARSGSTAIVTLPGHGFANGDRVLITGATQADYNGIFTISNVTANTFSYTVSNSPASPATGTIYVRRVDKAVSAIVYSGTLATATVPGHGFATGNIVRIVGAAQTQYNGDFVITVVDANTFTYGMSSVPASDATGTIAAINVISPSAHRYTGPITLTESALVKVRVVNWPTWSALSEQQFFVNPPASAGNLAVTEVNYHPVAPATGSPYNTDDFQFIELRNISATETIDLTDVQLVLGYKPAFSFTGCAVTTLSPGQYVLIAENRDALVQRYGGAIAAQIAGEFSGELDHGSQRVHLQDFAGRTIADFTYSDSGAWPGRADGKGFSLEIVNPAGNYNDPGNWRASSEYLGTPGRAGVGPINAVVVNEVLSHSDYPLYDAIELYNSTNVAVNIGGWYLSDSSDDFKKYRIPDGTLLGPYEYRVFTEGQFGAYFGLNGAKGDDVWLIAADPAGNLTYFIDHVEFGAAASGESFGRWPNATGGLYPQTSRTLGWANSGPRVGPALSGAGWLVIGEVMYCPPTPAGGLHADELEYVKIDNPGSAPVTLASLLPPPNPDNKVSGWRLRGDVDFDFAVGTSIAPGGSLVVVSFDPLNNPDALARFRARYPNLGAIPLVGPYSGKLGNGSGSVRLLRPDSPPLDDPTYVPHVLEDQINYSDASPWPAAADGAGYSLLRQSANTWGNDPASWLAAAPSFGFLENPPVAADDKYSILLNGTVTIAAPGLLANDSDADPGASLTVVWEQGPSHGALVLNSDGSFVYKPAWNFRGTDSFTYKASDGQMYSKTAAVTITVNPIAGRYIFYNNSRYDAHAGYPGGDPAPNTFDNAAIAVDKAPLLPDQNATFANYTSFSRGINGIMLDILGLSGALTAADFQFKVGNDDDPANWVAAPAPSSITIRSGGGMAGSSRVTIIWDDNAIQNTWLQVTVLPTVYTGLATAEVFYFGNAIGESGDNGVVDENDELASRTHKTGFSTAAVTNPYDYNRDGKVNATDDLIARDNASFVLQLIVPSMGAPLAAMDALEPLQLVGSLGSRTWAAVPQEAPSGVPDVDKTSSEFVLSVQESTSAAGTPLAGPSAAAITNLPPTTMPVSTTPVRSITARAPSANRNMLVNHLLDIFPDVLERFSAPPNAESPRQPLETRPSAVQVVVPPSVRRVSGQQVEKCHRLFDSVFTRLITRQSIRESLMADEPFESIDVPSLIAARKAARHAEPPFDAILQEGRSDRC
jgi:hypothetical protein